MRLSPTYVRLAALVAALGLGVTTRPAHAQPGGMPTADEPREPATRAPRDTSLDVPWTSVVPDGCALDLAVSLDAPGASGRSVAFVAAPSGASATCAGGTVLWEVPRGVLDAGRALPQTRYGRLHRRVAAPIVACDTAYSVLTCVRDAHGQLRNGNYAGNANVAQQTATTHDAARPIAAASPAASVTVEPAERSWDCQLTVEVTTTALPDAAQSVAIVAARHRGARSARHALACSAGAVSTELSRTFLDTMRRDGGEDARLELRLSGGPIRCEALVDVGACLRDEGGVLAPAEPLARVGRAGPTCLAGGTLVDTPLGAVAVESLVVGATVISRNPTTGAQTLAIVERIQPIEDRPVREVLLDASGLLRATPEHLVWSASRRAFVRVDALRVGERLLRRGGGSARVREVRDPLLRETVYDLSVTSPDTYFASGVLCHNY